MKESLLDKDKLYHFLVCLVISIVSWLAAVGAALAKEYGDSKANGNHWCWLDLVADFVGIGIGFGLNRLLLMMLV